MLRTEVWAGVQLSKLSAEVHEYEGGLEGARPCVGPQAYVVIKLRQESFMTLTLALALALALALTLTLTLTVS